ncbi:hypothetical protein D1AOALGA4SA_888 [Olavius algarvensis Delta 1 endosymbiont]|nr:hypothetical protein D1AOALGA4SA_888 [Olavius algarvensis Delta 1 endosymbiont]
MSTQNSYLLLKMFDAGGRNRSIEWTHKRKNSHYISMIR